MRFFSINRKFHRQLENYAGDLYRIAFSWCQDSALAQDLTQDSMEKALKNQHQLQKEEAIKSWLISILYRTWIDHCRRQTAAPLPHETMENTQSPPPDEASERLFIVEKVRAAVARLNPGHREVLTLVSHTRGHGDEPLVPRQASTAKTTIGEPAVK